MKSYRTGKSYQKREVRRILFSTTELQFFVLLFLSNLPYNEKTEKFFSDGAFFNLTTSHKRYDENFITEQNFKEISEKLCGIVVFEVSLAYIN